MTRTQVEGLESEPVRVFYPIWKQPWIAVNRSTYVHDVLARSGAVNVCADREMALSRRRAGRSADAEAGRRAVAVGALRVLARASPCLGPGACLWP